MVVCVGVWGHHGYSKVFVLGQPFAHCSVHWCWCCWFLCNVCICLWELLVLDLVWVLLLCPNDLSSIVVVSNFMLAG